MKTTTNTAKTGWRNSCARSETRRLKPLSTRSSVNLIASQVPRRNTTTSRCSSSGGRHDSRLPAIVLHTLMDAGNGFIIWIALREEPPQDDALDVTAQA